jgi:tRNA(fMet)-specific endonuclease VapC
MILDTSFLIDVLRGSEAVDSLVRSVDESGRASVSTISMMELWEGVRLTDATESERTAVRELLDGLREVPFDRACAIEAGTISATLQQSGRSIETADVQIAATARVHDEAVVTRNVDHFSRVDGVSILDY